MPDAAEEACNLRPGPLRILAVRKVTDTLKHREIKVGKRLTKPVRPGIREQRVVLAQRTQVEPRWAGALVPVRA